MDDREPHHRAERDADKVEKLEHPGSFAAAVGVKTLGEIHRHHHPDEAGGHALHRTPDEETDVASFHETDRQTRQRRDRGGNEHHHLAAELLGEIPGDEAGERGAQHHRAGEMGDLRGREKPEAARVLVRRPDIRQRRPDYGAAEIEKQASASGYDQKIDRVSFNLVHCLPFLRAAAHL